MSSTTMSVVVAPPMLRSVRYDRCRSACEAIGGKPPKDVPFWMLVKLFALTNAALLSTAVTPWLWS